MAADFIKISDSVSVRKKCIEAIESTETGTVVYTSMREFPTTLPAQSLIDILEIYTEQDDKIGQILAIKKTEGSFAG